VKPDNQYLLPVLSAVFLSVPIHAHSVRSTMTIYPRKRTIVMIVGSAVSVEEKIISIVPPAVPATLQIYGIITSA